MKIGILTFHRAQNYGAVLQCYALQEVLKNMGHTVSVIDYRQPYIESEYKLFHPEYLFRINLFKSINYLRKFIFSFPSRYKKHKGFKRFRDHFLNITSPIGGKNIPNDYNLYIIGSDQLWNPGITNGLDDIYWGYFNAGNGHIAGYAISTNQRTLEQIDKKTIQKALTNFSQISFREQFISEAIRQITGNDYPTTLDPTLLTEESTWSPLINQKWADKKYIVLYEVRFPSQKDTLLEKTRQKAKEMNCNLIVLSGMKYSPDEFVTIIRYAELVITSSFHATLFSIIFKRNFCSYSLEDGNDERYTKLLHSLGLDDHILRLADAPKIIKTNFSTVEEKLRQLKTFSMQYLSDLSSNKMS